MKNQKAFIVICILLVLVLIVILVGYREKITNNIFGIIGKYGRNNYVRITYPSARVGFDGEFISNRKSVSYNECYFWRGNVYPVRIKEISRIEPSDSDALNNLSIIIDGNGICESGLTIDTLEKNGAGIIRDSKEKDLFGFNMQSPLGFNPPYLLTGIIYKGKIMSISFSIRINPDSAMAPARENPIKFSYKGKNFELPITNEEIKSLFGVPPIVEEYKKE